jgi:glyoxylase-like metal-dependent hydrolase (beta-lactamase superfamily II)
MRIQVGDIEVTLLRTGCFRLDGGAMFGVVPRPLWEKLAPPDARNRIGLGLNCLLVRGPGLPGSGVVVDTGIGSKWDAKGREIYAIEDDPGIEGALAAEGVRAEEVREVLLTHLHFDHAGGNTRRGADGRPVATFPNARYHVSRGNLEEEALSPIELRKASYLPENWEPIRAAGRLALVEGTESEVFPGITLAVTGGHQRWHCMVLVRSRGETLAFTGDLIPTAAHLQPPWIMAYDHYPLETLARKKELLPRAASERWTLVLEHEPAHPAGRVAQDGARFRWEPLPSAEPPLAAAGARPLRGEEDRRET